MVGCSSAAGHANPTTSAPSTTKASTPPTTAHKRPPPTTSPLPVAPQATPDAAAGAFMQGWMAGNRPLSASVATASAVATLFAAPYQQQPLNDRGCSDAFPPFQCTWGPFGGGSGSIYQITLSPASGGRWYVSGVLIES